MAELVTLADPILVRNEKRFGAEFVNNRDYSSLSGKIIAAVHATHTFELYRWND